MGFGLHLCDIFLCVWLGLLFAFVVPGELRQVVVLGKQTTDDAVNEACTFHRGAIAAVDASQYELCFVEGKPLVEVVGLYSTLSDEDAEKVGEAQAFFESDSFDVSSSSAGRSPSRSAYAL